MDTLSFKLHSDFDPTGDQPEAIDALTRGVEAGTRHQILEGVTGSGKTFTIANVIARTNRPTLVISHNKTLAAQLYSELKHFFPENAVEYFVSYYDYYQPEAYIPQTDTYIEKDSSINEEIERMRLSATNSLLSRQDVIIIASVSCIYGLGSPEDYVGMLVRVEVGGELDRDNMLRQLVAVQYERNDYETRPGTFRVRGDTVDIFPSYSEKGIRLDFFGDEVERIREIDPASGKVERELQECVVSPAKHFVMAEDKIAPAIARVLTELDERVAWFESQGKLLEAQRLSMRTRYDMEMLKEIGYCSGIENYSRHLSGREEGAAPACLLDYFRGDFLTVIDESHVTIPQVRGMYNGDQARKAVLIEHGFRLPSARDNRPLNFAEFQKKTGPIIFATATPAAFEREVSGPPIRQVIRPTGLVDPPVEIRPLDNQIDDLIEEVKRLSEQGERVLCTTLTKRTSEDLTDYLRSSGLRVEYLHSEINAIDRVDILRRLRLGEFDCLVGVNLLREGLDLPEVALVAVLDADKEGFLRSETSLIQTAGRTARHINGRVILYADRQTNAIERLLSVTEERRKIQLEYNEKHGITPVSAERRIEASLVVQSEGEDLERSVMREEGIDYDVHKVLHELEQEMLAAAAALEFERAATIRDEINELKAAAGIEVKSSGKKRFRTPAGTQKRTRRS